jgi:predicted transcriptional regulator
MTTLTVEIDKERDLPELEAVFDRMGLKFRLNEDVDDDDDDWGDLPEAAIGGIKAGLADAEAGRTHSHEYVMAQMDKKIAEFRAKNDR